MKVFSDDAVTKHDLDKITKLHAKQLDNTNEKQTQQILQLRLAVALSFLVNLALTLGLYLINS